MEQQDPDGGEGVSDIIYNPDGIRPSWVVDVESPAELAKLDAGKPPAPWPVKPGSKRSVVKNVSSTSIPYFPTPQQLAPELVLPPLDNASLNKRWESSRERGIDNRKSDENGSSSEIMGTGQQGNQDSMDKGRQPVLRASASTSQQRNQDIASEEEHLYSRASSSSDLQFADNKQKQHKFTTELPTPPYVEEQLETIKKKRAEYEDRIKELLFNKEVIEQELMENENEIKDCDAKLAVTTGVLTEEEFAAAMEKIHLSRCSIAAGKASTLEPPVPKLIPSEILETLKASNEFPKRPLAPTAAQPKSISLLSIPSTALDMLAEEASQLPPAPSRDTTQPQPVLSGFDPRAGPSMTQSRRLMPLTNLHGGLSSPHTGPSRAGPENTMVLPITPHNKMQPQPLMACLHPHLDDPIAQITHNKAFPATAQSIPQFSPMAISVPFQGFSNAYQRSNPAPPASPTAYPALSYDMPQPSPMATSIPYQGFSKQYSGPNPMHSAHQFVFPAPHSSVYPQLPSMPCERSRNPYPMSNNTAQVTSQVADAMDTEIAAPSQPLPCCSTPSCPIPPRQDPGLFSNPFAGPTPGVSADVPMEISSSPMSPGEG